MRSTIDNAARSLVPVRKPSQRQVEAAARAWMAWQFPGRLWDDAVPELKQKFMEAARSALLAAYAMDSL